VLFRSAKFVYIIILYEAVPGFLFSCAFLLTSFNNFVTVFMAGILKILAAGAFVACTFFIPFALCSFSENIELRRAFDFEGIVRGVKGVLAPYLVGYVLSGACLYVTYKLHRIPYLIGFILSSLLTYYVLVVATYYYSQLFKKTPLAGRPRG
jgi:hypothetical protein